MCLLNFVCRVHKERYEDGRPNTGSKSEIDFGQIGSFLGKFPCQVFVVEKFKFVETPLGIINKWWIKSSGRVSQR